MFSKNALNNVRAQYVPVLVFVCLFGLLALPPREQQRAQAQSLNPCTTDQPMEGTVFALTTNNTLVNFDPGSPDQINSSRFISGLATGETILAIDFRPATGQLFGVSNASRLYLINPVNGVATPVGTAFTPALSGDIAGFDFNPVVDRIRIVTSTGQNLRLNPLTGVVAGTDTNLSFAAGDPNAGATPNITSVAYTNSSSGVSATTLYGIDPTLDVLVRQGSVNGAPTSPNTGQLTTIGPLGVNVSSVTGFDIVPGTNAAFATLTTQDGTNTQLYSINLTTGAATPVGTIGGGQLIRDLAFRLSAENIYALVCDSNTLLRFNAGAPGALLATIQINGLAANERIIGIDFRPATGQLFGVSNTSRIYIINTNTGVATAVSTTAFTPALSGTNFGIDFNPAVDRLRLVSSTGQNLRLNPSTGAVAGTDTTIAFATTDTNNGQTPNLVSVAYANNVAGTSTTTLYGIDASRNVLVTQGSTNSSPVSPNSGQLFTIGALGFDPNNTVGFDISSTSGAAFAAFSEGSGASQLYSINLTTGAATLIGAIGNGQAICDIAVETDPQVVFGVTASNRLVSFNAGAPGTVLTTQTISGLAGNETIIGLDFRPATQELYALSSGGRIYLLNTSTGVATLVSAAPLNPTLNGNIFGFNFNPAVDRIRLVTSTGQNLRINPITGAVVATDTNLTFAAGDPNAGGTPNLLGVAYNNSFLGASSTTLYAIDATGSLVTIGSVNGNPTSPNSGQLFTVGSLGIPVSGQTGFDIAPGSNVAFVTVTPADGGASQLYSINLTTGAATLVGAVGVNEPLRVLTVGNQDILAAQAQSPTICLQDNDSGDNLQINTCTGDYQFTHCGTGGFTLRGRGTLGRLSSSITLRDARVTASISTNPFGVRQTGRAVVKLSLFGPTFIIDDNGGSDTCGCQ